MKTAVWRLVDRIPALPVTVGAGPASGLAVYSPLRYRRSYRTASYEPHVVAALERLVRPGMMVLDCGSHLGYHALVLARLVGPGGRVWAFEPHRRHLALLGRACRRNRLAQVTPVGLAVGATSGSARLFEPPLSTMSFLVEGPAPSRGERVVEIERVALDDWARTVELDHVDLIKLDIEGGELAAIEGAGDLLARWRPLIVCEVHCGSGIPYRPRRLVERLREVGYRVEPIARPGADEESLEEILERAARRVLPPGTRGIFHILATPESGE